MSEAELTDRLECARSGKQLNRWFTAEVLSVLRGAGFLDARLDRATDLVTLVDPEDEDLKSAWSLKVRSTRHIDLAAALDQVTEAARDSEHLFAASVQRRIGHPAEDAYVVMRLSNFIGALARLEPEHSVRPSP